MPRTEAARNYGIETGPGIASRHGLPGTNIVAAIRRRPQIAAAGNY
jgi:hypothetical protein